MCVKLYSRLSVKVQVAADAGFASRETKHGERYRNGRICSPKKKDVVSISISNKAISDIVILKQHSVLLTNTNLSDLNVGLELARCTSRRRKYGTSVSVRIGIDNIHGLF